MVNFTQRYYDLEKKIKERVPGFKICFKDESTLMKLIGKILFFNKGFMTRYTTTIGKRVYFPSKKKFEENPGRYYHTLAHEYVHVMDYVRHPVIFIIGYMKPQLIAILSLLSFLAFINPYFLLFLLALLFLAPIPSPYRTWAELRGYGMNCKVRLWHGETISQERLNYSADAFITSAYYFMCPFRKWVMKKLKKWADPNDNSCLLDKNPAFKDVHDLIT